MVCTVDDIKGSGAAADYYSQTDDYYRDQGHAPTAWQGRGAEALGLHGEVETYQAEAMLEGRLPNGERVGGDDHRPGWDATFSAPKSVSVAAYVHGDDRLISAHDKAVSEAIAWLERETACTRIREDGAIRTEATGNLVAATYRHDVNREGEPDLHTHSVIMNMTQDWEGRWRSLESRPLYRLQTEAGAVYRAVLARECERLGYDIEKTMAGDHPSFELRQVAKELRDRFSERSHQIERELEKMGLTRKTATAEQKQIAALNTRQAKQDLDRGNLLHEWREQARQAGHELGQRPEAREIDRSIYEKRADEAVKSAVAHLSERESRFTSRQIVAEARKIGMGCIDDRDIELSISRAVRRGELVERETRQFDAITGQKTELSGFTTREAIETERRMLSFASAAAGAAQPAMSREQADEAIRAQETKPGAFAFNPAQIDATHAVLAGNDRITLIQGYAGTAKTTSVLAASSAAFREQGYEVVALAPTRSAAKTLGESISAASNTVASFINKRPEASEKPRVYIVDEASMLSARDMEKLLTRTQGSRLVMVGDVKQLGSVEAGAAFRQMQADSGLKTQILDQIVRQRNDELRAAVYDAIKGDIRGALSKIEVVELKTRAERIDYTASRYSALPADERAKRIVIAPGRDDRREINDAVRLELAARGELGQSVTIKALDARDMTDVERRRAASYSVGDQVEAGRDYKSLGLKRGDFARIVAVDVDKNRLTLETVAGVRKEIDPSRVTKLTAFEPRDMQIAVGDQLTNRANTRDLENGAALRVEGIDDGHIHVRDSAGKLHRIDTIAALRVDHGYAQTGHESQGRTAFGGFLHAESHRTNLMSRQNFYVPISRATDTFTIVTDDREALAQQIERETGQKESALDAADQFRNPFPNPKDISETHLGIGNTFPKDISESETAELSTPARQLMPWEVPEHVRAQDTLVVDAPARPAVEFGFDR